MTARDRSRSPRGRGFGPQDEFPLVDFLVSRHILDDRSAGALRKAPRESAIEVLVSLGPEVRNPSAFVTRRLAPSMGHQDNGAAPAGAGGSWHPNQGEMNRSETPGVIHVWANGHQQELFWTSQEQAVSDLKSWGVLDDASGDFLLKASEQDAMDVISAIGPAVKNPSAFVTRKLQNLKGSAAAHQPDSTALVTPVEGGPVQVFFNGEYHELPWNSRDEALAQLVSMGVLDEGSADFLKKAPEVHAKSVIASLGPEVRNPSAFVTRKLKALRAQDTGMSYDSGGSWRKDDVIMVHFGGSAKPLQWQTRDTALAQLKEWGVLDEVSADFLSKAPEHCAKEIIGSIGPEVRNPSAFVTRKVKELQQAGFTEQRNDRGGGMLGPGMGGCGMGMGGCGMGGCGMGGCGMGGCGMGGCGMGMGMGGCGMGMGMGGMGGGMCRGSTQEMVGNLMKQGVLDSSSADLLMQIPEQRAQEILSGLGPDVRNPSAWVTRKIKEIMTGGGGMMGNSMMQGGGMMQMGMGGCGMGMSGMGMGGKGFMNQGVVQGELTIHFNGEEVRIPWTSKAEVLQRLQQGGVLDEKSCDFLVDEQVLQEEQKQHEGQDNERRRKD
ncbi:unnamed protein product [Prorocentrum cordatum]|uniref:Uncharacterized protein n=1 Tax=Prorocentrum cordatum TaxID=2364126 RepID=A0ABN9RG85_9DINO|nr:unnamed protein product [Polarella glacialis]